jgi:hypothetical protein
MSELGMHRFCCSPERHLFRSGLALAVYQKLYGVTHKNGWVYHSSKEALQHFFGASRKGIHNAFKLLVKHGWLEEQDANQEALSVARKMEFRPKNYRVVQHNEWALKHGAQCLDETMPWDGEEKDKLGSDLWNASTGKLQWYANQLRSLRSSGFTDEKIVAEFRSYVENVKQENDASGKYKQRGYINWKTTRWAFLKLMKGIGQERADLTAPSPSRLQRVAA